MQAGGSNWQTLSTDIGRSWSDPTGINLGVYNGTSVGPGRGLQLSEDSPAPGRILFIGHHGPYEVSKRTWPSYPQEMFTIGHIE